MTGLGWMMTVAMLTLAWFAAINAVASIAAGLAGRLFEDGITGDARRARRLLTVRLAPAVSSLMAATAVILPAHAWLEPAESEERIGTIVVTLAALGLGLLLVGVARWVGAMRTSVRVSVAARDPRLGHDIGRIREVQGYSGITLAGILRPRILVGSRARRVLTPAELDLAIAHEDAHLQARDNLSRLAIHCAPDFLGWFPAARRVERLWAGETECLADAAAAAGSVVRAERLAAALVKVARLSGDPQRSLAPWAPGWSSFHHPALIETRVRLLIAGVRPPVAPGPWLARAVVWGSAGLAAAWLAGVPHRLHWLTEELLALLP